MDDSIKRDDVLQAQLSDVATRLAVIRVEHDTLKAQTEILSKQMVLSEQTAIAIREKTVAITDRTDQHAKNIEHLQSLEVDNSKILSQHDKIMSQHTSEIKEMQENWSKFLAIVWGTMKWTAVTIGGLGMGVVFSHFIK